MTLIKHHTDIDQEAKLFFNLIKSRSNSNSIAHFVFKKHPKLDKEKISEDEITKYLKNYYSDKKDEISNHIKNLNNNWENIEDSVMDVFSEIFEINKEDLPEADGYACSIDIFPRDVDVKVFFYGNHLPTEVNLVTTVHEYTHFLYFDQWKKQYPQDFPDIDSPPHKLWQASEVMAIIITMDERFIKLIPHLKFQDFNYNNKNYAEITVEEKQRSIAGLFSDLYLDKKNQSISQFITSIRNLTFSIPDKYWH